MRYANLDIEAKSMVPSANGTNSLDWKFISNVKKIVDENINNPEFSVNVLCESSGMSRTSFYCKLKALTGQSPTEFIRGMRLKRATELLKEGEYALLMRFQTWLDSLKLNIFGKYSKNTIR